jgi:hypothetical protein
VKRGDINSMAANQTQSQANEWRPASIVR